MSMDNNSSSSSSSSDSVSHNYKYRGRILGPKLCTTCVCNRRGVVKQYSTSLVLPQFCGLLWCCLPTIKKMKNKSSSSGNSSIDVDDDNDLGDNDDVALLLRHDKKSRTGISANSSSRSNSKDVDDDDELNSNIINNNLKKKHSIEVISIASHCPHCDLCVVDQDHHCIYLK